MCERDVNKILYTEPLNTYYQVVQWYALRLMLILKYIIFFQSKSINFINAFAQAYIPRGGGKCIELPRDYNIDRGQCDDVLRLKKILYGQTEARRL